MKDYWTLNEVNDEKGINQFLSVAIQVYENDSVWVPESEQTFLERFKAWKSSLKVKMWPFVALVDKHPVARGAAILAAAVKDEDGSPQGWIGFFESLEEIKMRRNKILHSAKIYWRWLERNQSWLQKSIICLLAFWRMDLHYLIQSCPTIILCTIWIYSKKVGYQVRTKLHTFNFTREQ